MLPTQKNRPIYGQNVLYTTGPYVGSPTKVSQSASDVANGWVPETQPAAEQENWIKNDFDVNILLLRQLIWNVVPAVAADVANMLAISRNNGQIFCVSNDNIVRRAFDTAQAVSTFTYTGEAPAGKFFTGIGKPDVGPGWLVIGGYSGSPPGTPIGVWVYDPDAATFTPTIGSAIYTYPTIFLVMCRGGQAYTFPNVSGSGNMARIETNGHHSSFLVSMNPNTSLFSQLAGFRSNTGVDRLCHMLFTGGHLVSQLVNGDGTSYVSVTNTSTQKPMGIFYSTEFQTFLCLDQAGQVWSVDPSTGAFAAFSTATVTSPATLSGLDNGFINDLGWFGFWQDTNGAQHCYFAPDFKTPRQLALKENLTFFDGECYWIGDSSVSGTGYHRTQHNIL